MAFFTDWKSRNVRKVYIFNSTKENDMTELFVAVGSG